MFSPLYKSTSLTCSFGEALVAFWRCGAFSGLCFDVEYFDIWLQSWRGWGSRGLEVQTPVSDGWEWGRQVKYQNRTLGSTMVLGSRANTIMHDQRARSRITGQLGAKFMSFRNFLLWSSFSFFYGPMKMVYSQRLMVKCWISGSVFTLTLPLWPEVKCFVVSKV